MIFNPSSAGALPYLKYCGLLTQIGAAAPTLIVLENDLGTLSTSYLASGLYAITSFGVFSSGKTFFRIGEMFYSFQSYAIPLSRYLFQVDDTEIDLLTLDPVTHIALDGSPDCFFNNSALEIRVYL